MKAPFQNDLVSGAGSDRQTSFDVTEWVARLAITGQLNGAATVSLPALMLLFFLNPTVHSFELLFAVMYEVLVTERKGSDLALPPDLGSLVTSVHIADRLQTRPLT